MDGDWSLSPVTFRLKDKVWKQLGTSGGDGFGGDSGKAAERFRNIASPCAGTQALNRANLPDSGLEVVRFLGSSAINPRPCPWSGLRPGEK